VFVRHTFVRLNNFCVMKSFRFLKERWPLICLSLVTALVAIWAGFMVHEVTSPRDELSPVTVHPLPSPLPSPVASIPAWVKTAPPLVAPSPSNPSVLPSQGVLPQASVPVAPSPSASATPAASIATRNAPLPQARYGHLPYAEAAQDRLVSIGTYGEGEYKRTEYLDRDAAAAFDQMVTAAKTDGVTIVPISGFRTIADQEKLFKRQIQRQGSETAAATLSAPPGYSEHHSGYALDIGDGTRPKTDVKFEFEEAPAYKWMISNAKRYGFELSYPRNNVQGVSFEPWHWRFVNSTQASAVFSVAHSLRQ
jgi:zinc D-Ala-D-Ala carboxypeptidase